MSNILMITYDGNTCLGVEIKENVFLTESGKKIDPDEKIVAREAGTVSEEIEMIFEDILQDWYVEEDMRMHISLLESSIRMIEDKRRMLFENARKTMSEMQEEMYMASA